MKKFVIDCKDVAVLIDGGADFVMLLARMIGRDQVFAPVLDPFDWLAEFQRGGANENVLGIKFAADAEAAADMALEQLDGFPFPSKHLRERIAIPMRHLGGAIHFQNIARLIVTGDGAARLQRHAGMAADGKLKRNNRLRVAEGGVHVAIALAHDAGLRTHEVVEEVGLIGANKRCSERFDINLDQVRGVFGDILILREHHRNRLADIADDILRQHRLLVGLEPFDAGEAKSDLRNVRDVGMRPHRVHAGQLERRHRIDGFYFPVLNGRAHHAHRPLPGKRNVGGEASLAQQQRAVFQTRNGAADEFGRGRHFPRIASAAARTALMMFW